MENLSKLPKWAQKEFENLQRERDIAVRALREYTDSQTESPFFIDELESTGDTDGSGPASYTRYVQTHKISVKHGGVLLDIYLRDNNIELQWNNYERHFEDIAFIPESYQKARLVHPDNMRK